MSVIGTRRDSGIGLDTHTFRVANRGLVNVVKTAYARSYAYALSPHASVHIASQAVC